MQSQLLASLGGFIALAVVFPRGTDPEQPGPVPLNTAPEPQGLVDSSLCLCTKPPPPESTGAALVFGHSNVTTPRSARGCHRPDRAGRSAPAPTAEDSWHPGGWRCSCSAPALDLLQRDQQEATFILRRATPSLECRSQQTEVQQDKIRKHTCPRQTAAPKQPKHLCPLP